MDKIINGMLQELYAIDPELAKHEAKLKKIARAMLLAAPKGELDEEFSRQLKERLMAKAMEMRQARESRGYGMFKWQILPFATAGAAVAALLVWIILPAMSPSMPGSAIPSITDLGFVPKVAVKPAGMEAFGSLAMAQPASGQPVATGMGSSGSSAPSGQPVIGLGGGGGSATGMVMPPFEYVNYKFNYQGDGFEMPTGSLPVLKNVKDSGAAAKAAQVLKKVSFGLFDINKFSGLSVSSINFSEDADRGYMASLSMDDELLAIYRNWSKWPQPQYEGQLSRADAPSDEEIIAIADAFASRYGVDLSGYGAPHVDDSWVRYQPADSSYYPDSVSVIYPLLHDGAEVLDESGNLTGPRINVNIRDRQADSLWDLRTNSYLASDYSLESSKDRVLEIVGRGGHNRVVNPDAATVEGTVGDPELHYVRIYRYTGFTTDTLLVPALVFPVVQKPDANFYQDKIVVPLVKEILDAQQPDFVIMQKAAE